ncbi:transcription elongation factor GreB [Arboricoccus pini]|uniref:Transcription elongation factor GreB n=1 Tax=Arboricoccus pini TaxID=1963835 RepID=A0A212RCM1_9PROT|nr:GreA/GreB family elongation factor [Arboricoccus pini]SNB69996.1 transcription elongation factor GreB [Arboricoccus pini]
MSRAFVNEDATQGQIEIPDRAVSGRPNLVTANGIKMMDEKIASLRAALDAHDPDAPGDATAKERQAVLIRDLRYWQQRRSTAQLVTPSEGPIDEVSFGTSVTLRDANGQQRTYRLVGEDEADPTAGLLNWTAPLGEALLGAVVGDEVSFDPSRPPMEVLRIER